jgi:hypothetical protein
VNESITVCCVIFTLARTGDAQRLADLSWCVAVRVRSHSALVFNGFRAPLAALAHHTGHEECLMSACDDLWFGEDIMNIRPTVWFPLDRYTPVRDGWYEVQLVSGETAFAKFGANEWSEKPLLVFTHWRGLSADPSRAGETDSFSAEATAAQGVRAAWNAFFPGLGEEQHKPLDIAHSEKH